MLVLVIFLFAIAAAGASDVDDSPLASEDTNQVELSADNTILEDNLKTSEEKTTLAVGENDETLSSETDLEILTADQLTFSELRDKIGSGGNINLTKGTYTYNDGDGDTIQISTSGVINGNGAVIDMAQSGHRAFYVTVTDVTIKNLTIKNANYNGNGGAIFFSGPGNVTNCNFANNSAMGGGAVYFNSTGEVTGCNFVNNTVEIPEDAEGGGGALRFSKDGTVRGCNFIDNAAVESWGAAVYFDGPGFTGTIINCNFTNNTATVDGGAISFNSHDVTGNVMGCIFTNNTARYGGAIDTEGMCNVSSCNFTNNKAASGSGGAIYFSWKGEVTDCNFIDNSAWGRYNDGGAIQIYSGKVTCCNFTNNSASSNGGAISFSLNTEVTNCNFANNKATSGKGGAIYIWDTYETGSTIENCSFNNNRAASEIGGAIYFRSIGAVEKCNFTNNSARNGGAVYFGDAGTANNCIFTNNKASSDGGAIYFDYWGTVENCNFTNNKVAYKGGAIYFRSFCNVENCNFTGNDAATGSAIYLWSDSTTKNISNSCFLNNRANADRHSPFIVIQNGNNIEIYFIGQNNLLNAIYSEGDVNFTDVDYWGANGITNTDSSAPTRSSNESGQSITVIGIVNGNIFNTTNLTDADGKIVIESVSDYLIIACHYEDSYYTKAETISTNMKFHANVTPLATHNRTVNITAESNIPNDILDGKLLFVLPTGENITANYAGNGTWWALHTFDDCGDYQVNATYVGLDNVTIGNAAVTVKKIETELTAKPVTTTYKANTYLVITLKDNKGNVLNGIGVLVDLAGVKTYTTDNNGQIKVFTKSLTARTYIATITFSGNTNYDKSTKDVKVTVNKAVNPLKIKAKTAKVKFSKLKKKTQKLKVTKVVKFAKKGIGTLTYKKVKGNKKITINKKTGKVTIKKRLKKGTYKVKVKIKAKGNANYKASSFKTLTFKIKVK